MEELTDQQLSHIRNSLCEQLKKYHSVTSQAMKCFDHRPHDSHVHDSSNQIFMNILNSIDDETKKIDQFELRMVIVATMKSGKSTIINSLIGENILPTRGSAMTTLPTEVVFKRSIGQPTLVLADEIIELVMCIQKKIHDYVHFNESSINGMLDDQSHLIDIIKKIEKAKDGIAHHLTNYIVALDKIQSELIFINDLIRILLLLSRNENNPLKDVSLKPFLKKNIRLEVPVSNLTGKFMYDIKDSIGSLTIVDTPGPNEATASQELRDIVVEELQKASIVALVINFTAMGTDADQDIFKEISAIRNSNIDDDYIYVIVNKVDQRRRGDMSVKDVKSFISSKYQITEKTSELIDRRVFEMKAIHCLVFRRFMKEKEEYEKNNKICVLQEMETGEDLTRELYQLYNFDEDGEKDFQSVCKDAEKMWNKAGLKEFIEGPISDLFKKLAPKSIKSAVNVCFRHGNELRKQIIERQQLLKVSTDKLEEGIIDLEKDCKDLARIEEENRKKLKCISVDLRKELDDIIEKASKQSQRLTVELFTKEAWDLRSEKGRYYAQNVFGVGLIAGGLLTATILSGGSIGLAAAAIAIGTASGSTALRNADDSKTFKGKTEAKNFTDSLRDDVNSLCKAVYDSVQPKINDLFESKNNSLVAHLKTTTENIIINFNKTLDRSFEITLTTLTKFNIEIVESNIDENKSIEKYRSLWGYSLFQRKTNVSDEEEAKLLQEENTKLSEEEKAKLSEEKARLSEEKSKLLEKEKKLSEEKAKLSEEKARLSEEKSKLLEKEKKLSEEKAKLSEEKARLSEEKSKLLEKEKKLSEEKAKSLEIEEAKLSEEKKKLSEKEAKLTASSVMKYVVSKKELKNICDSIIEANMNQLREEIDKYFNELLNNTFNSHFQELNDHFTEYREKMKSILRTRTTTKQEQEQLRSDLDRILKEVETENANVIKIAKMAHIHYKYLESL